MEKLIIGLNSAVNRSEKVVLIDRYILENSLHSDLIPLMAEAKYLPETAIKALFVDIEDSIAVMNLKTLKNNNYNPDRGLIFQLVDKGSHKAAASMITLFNIALTKSELMAIANKGGVESIIVAITLSKALDDEMVESLIRSSLNDDLDRIILLVKEIENYRELATDKDMLEHAQRCLLDRFGTVLTTQISDSLKQQNRPELNRLMALHREQLLDYRISVDTGGYVDNREREFYNRIISDPESTQIEFNFSLSKIGVGGDKGLTEGILKNLERFDALESITRFSCRSIDIPLLKKVLKKSLSNEIKSLIIFESYKLDSEQKISIAKTNGLLNSLIQRINDSDSRSRRSKTGSRSFLTKALIASEGDFATNLPLSTMSSTLVSELYAALTEEDRKGRLTALLSLESEYTKDLRRDLSEKDKELAKDLGKKVNITSKKRTWFTECLKALRYGELAEFRGYITADYSLQSFIKDSKTSNNKERMSRIGLQLRRPLWLNLTNEELQAVQSVGFSLEDNFPRCSDFTIERTWLDSDIATLTPTEQVVCVALTRNKLELLLFLQKNKKFLGSGGYSTHSFQDIIDFIRESSKDGLKSAELDALNNEAFNIIQPDTKYLEYETILSIIKDKPKTIALQIIGDVDRFSLGEYLAFSCKSGQVFTIDDSFPLHPFVFQQITKGYSLLRALKDLRHHSLHNIAETIIRAYLSPAYKTELMKLGITPPARRTDTQDLKNMLGEVANNTAEKTVSLRGMKGVLRSMNASEIQSLTEKFKITEITAAINKAWETRNNIIEIGQDEIKFSSSNSEGISAMNSLLSSCDLTLLVVGQQRYRARNQKDLFSSYSNIRYKILQFANDSVAADAQSYQLYDYVLSDFIKIHGSQFMAKLEGFNLTGSGADLLISMDAQTIISGMRDNVATIYLLGEKGQLNYKTFINLQEKRVDADPETLRELATYIASKLNCNVEDVPFLFSRYPVDGLRMLNEEDSIMISTKAFIDDFAKGDRAINISRLSSQRKLELIIYALKSWNITIQADPAELNLEDVDSLDYWTLESFKNIEPASLAGIFGYRADDKKTLLRVKDLLATHGPSLIRNALVMKELWGVFFNNSVKLTLEDTLGTDQDRAFCDTNSGEITELLNSMNSTTLARNAVISLGVSTGKLRDWLNTGKGYFQDTFEVIERTLTANNSIHTATAQSIGLAEEDYQTIKVSSDAAVESIRSVLKNSNFSVIHDVVMKLTRSNDKDMLQLENQGHYAPLEKKEVSEDIGYSLFFPKLYADTFALGTQNGWCVCSSKSYSENVRQGKAILVGIGPKIEAKNKEELIKNCEALLYIVFDRFGNVSSHQIQFSKLMNKDLSHKMSEGSNRNEILGMQQVPPVSRYPVGVITKLIQEVRDSEFNEQSKAA